MDLQILLFSAVARCTREWALPIPDAVINANSNVKQNPGY